MKKYIFIIIFLLTWSTDSIAEWGIQTLDSTGDVGRDTSIALDGNNKVHISYHDFTNWDLKYATNVTGSWVTSTLDSTGDVGEATSIAIDTNNKVHISYYDRTNTDLKYATNVTGSWVTSTLDNTGDVGYYTSIATDSNNKIHISYYDNTNGDLKYATNVTGSWVISTIDTAGSVGGYNSIALDGNNKVHISYYDNTNGDLKYATNVTGSWVTSTLDNTGDVGRYTSIVTDSNNKIHISYCDYTNTDLKYATNVTGSWVYSTLDTTYDVGFGTSIAVDSSGKIHISYWSFTMVDLKYATNVTGSWVISTLDSTGGRYPSIAIDSNNKIHISYFDDTNWDLKYVLLYSTTVTTIIDQTKDHTVTLYLETGEIKVYIPAGTFSENVNMSITTSTVSASDIETIKMTAIGIEITVDKALQPTKEITITIHYRDKDISGLDETKLVLGRYDETNKRWVQIPSTVYPNLNYVEGKTKHISKFAVMQLVPAGNLNSVKVYPNPYNPSRHLQGVTIDNLPANATVKIYTIIGELVRKLEDTDGDGRITWDGNNESGNKVGSEVYIGFIESTSGTKRIKIAVEK